MIIEKEYGDLKVYHGEALEEPELILSRLLKKDFIVVKTLQKKELRKALIWGRKELKKDQILEPKDMKGLKMQQGKDTTKQRKINSLNSFFKNIKKHIQNNKVFEK